MEISITKALRELKTLDARITKKVKETTFVTSKKSNETIRGYRTVEDFEKDVKETVQSINDLVARRKTLKKAIVESNATTTVEIAGVKMTVADAIERKKFIEVEKTLLKKMSIDFAQAQTNLEVKNEQAQLRLDSQLSGMISKDGKTDLTAVEGFKTLFWGTEKTVLIDPINISEVIKRLQVDIETFEQDVDVALSEVNARTNITLEEKAAV